MDLVWIVQITTAAIIGILSWNFKTLYAKAESIGKELADFKTSAATNFVSEARLEISLTAIQGSLQTLMSSLNRVEERLYTREQRVP
jgi:hypothetical protein